MRQATSGRRRRLGWVTAATVAATLLPASAAMAAGGTTTGADLQVSGSASTGSPSPGAARVTVQVKAAAGGRGGSVNKGGVHDTTRAPAAPCAAFGGLSAPVGYYLTWAAIWNTFTIRNCSANAETVNVEVTETNAATG